MQDVPTKVTARPFKWVGARPVRPDGVPKVTGRALYGADLTMPGMLVGRVLRSPHARARVEKIDVEAARASPGVGAAISLVDDDLMVHFLGEPVAALAADGPCTIEGAESAAVSFPEFFATLSSIAHQ